MNFKKRVNGSWTNTPHYIHNTSTDTLTTLPADIYANDTTATVGLKGDMSQTGTPTPTTPIQPQETGERTGNLFDKTTVVTGNILSDGTIGTNQAFRTSDYILVTPNTNYAASYLTIAYRGRAVAFYQNDKTFISALQNNVESDDGTAPFTFVTPDNCYFMRIATYVSQTNHIDELMLNTGSTPLPYEPYGFKIPILSANTTTPVYLGEVETTRRIKKYVFTGQEFIGKSSSSNTFYVAFTDMIKGCDALCSHFEYSGNTKSTVGTFYTPTTTENPQANFNWDESATADDFKTYLAQQYAAGTPVTVWYVLATPTTGIVNEPLRKIGDYADEVSGITIPTIAGANTLSIGTTLQPSEVTATYKGWHPVQSVHEYDSNYTIATMQALTIAQLQTHTISELQGGEWS